MKSPRRSQKSRCSHCHTLALESTPRRGVKAKLMKLLKRRPMHCYACEKTCYITKKARSVRPARVARATAERHTAGP